MKVNEIMTKDVVTLNSGMNAKEALEALFKRQISGLPIIDGEGKLLGMFTEKDVLIYTLPSYIGKVGKFIYEENPKSTRRKLVDLSNIKVDQIMRKEVVTVLENTTLCEVARIMLTQKVRRLPVLSNSGKILGIIARGDIIRALVKEADNSC